MGETGHPRPFDRRDAAVRARATFDDVWVDGDPWELGHAPLDQHRYLRQLELRANRRYRRAFEIGSAAGAFTRMLAAQCDEVFAIDVSERAVELDVEGAVEFRVANVMGIDLEPEGRWELVVLAETAYYLGRLHPMFDLGWLAHSLLGRTEPGGRLLLVNTFGSESGIMSPWLIRTYRDLFVNAGYRLDHEELMLGEKHGETFEILLSLLGAP